MASYFKMAIYFDFESYAFPILERLSCLGLHAGDLARHFGREKTIEAVEFILLVKP